MNLSPGHPNCKTSSVSASAFSIAVDIGDLAVVHATKFASDTQTT